MDKHNHKGMRKQNHNEKLSRNLSWVLRHGAIKEGLKISAGGFVAIDEILQYLQSNGHKDITFEQIEDVVENNDKKRFELKKENNCMFIRATQGHSMKEVETEELLKLIEEPEEYPVVIHGTFWKFWKLIKEQGLKRMTRNHIHFAPGMPKEQGVISGMRGNCDVIIQIDLAGAMKDGIKFFVSSNNVILTEGVDGVLIPKYFKKVMKKNGAVLKED